MTKYLYVLIFLLNPVLFAQEGKSDDTPSLLNEGKSIERVVLLLRLSEEIENSDIAKATKYSDEALTLAQDMKYEAGIAKGYLRKGRINFLQGERDSAAHYFQLALEMFTAQGNQIGIADSLNNVAILDFLKQNSQMALSKLESAKTIHRKYNNKKGMATSLNHSANIHKYLGNYNQALQNHIQALRLRTEINDQDGILASNNNLGNLYRQIGQREIAFEHYLKAAGIAKKTSNDYDLADIYMNIGIFYAEMKEYEKAIKYSFMAEEIFIATKSRDGEAVVNLNLGAYYKELDNYRKAMIHLEKAIEIFEALNIQNYQISIYIEMGEISRKKKDFRQAIELFQKGLVIATKLEFEPDIANIYVRLGQVYLALRENKQAEDYAIKAYKLSRQISDLPSLKLSLELLTDINENNKSFENAFNYAKELQAVSDSLLDTTKTKMISELEIKFEISQKQQEIENLSLKNELQKLSLERRKLTIIFIVVGLFFAFYIIFVISKKKSYQKKVNKVLAKNNKRISQASKELKELVHIMSHDLANHFLIIDGSIELSEMGDGKSLDEYKKRIKRATKNGIDVINLVREMRAVEENKLTLKRVNLLTAVNESIKLIRDKQTAKKLNIQVNIPDDYNVLVEPRSFINSVVNNIFTNAIKFSYENSTIAVVATQSHTGIKLSFKDNGIGIPDELLNKLFDFGISTSRLGTCGEKGTGFGMPLIKKFVELYGGQIELASIDIEEDHQNHGTEVHLFLKEHQK